MSPIEIRSQEPICISSNEWDITSKVSIAESHLVRGVAHVRPINKGADYAVRVTGFYHSPGGMIETQRLTTGNNVDDITLTTSEDPELSGELGVSEIVIDGIIYTATNP